MSSFFLSNFCLFISEAFYLSLFYYNRVYLFPFANSTEDNKFSVTITVPVGELMRGTSLSEFEFTNQQSKLTGMNESSTSCTSSQQISTNENLLADRILEIASLNRSPSPTVVDGKSFRYFFTRFGL